MTLADYSVSSSTFDNIETWKNTLKDVVTACNETESLGYMVPWLEEFIVVARSKLFLQTFKGGAFMNPVINITYYV